MTAGDAAQQGSMTRGSEDQWPAAAVSDRTTVGAFLRQADALAAKPLFRAFRDGGWPAIAWSDAREQVLAIAARLTDMGVARGDRVVILAPNSTEWILCDLAIQAAGGVTAPIYPTLTSAMAQRIVEDSGAAVAIVAGPDEADRLRPATGLQQVLRMDTDVAGWLAHARQQEEPPKLVDRLNGLKPEDLATIVYTSGTSGEPKGVEIRHGSMIAMAEAGLEAFPLGPSDVILSYLPYAHIFERVSGIFTPMLAGTEIWISRGMTHLVEDLAMARPTVMLGVPRVFEKMIDTVEAQARRMRGPAGLITRWSLERHRLHQVVDPIVLPRLRRRLTHGRLRFFISGGAPLLADVEMFFWRIGVPIYQGWGLTETTSAVSANRPDARRVGTVGQPLPGVQVKTGAEGELLVKGPGVMRGYHRNPAATAEVFDPEGWFKSGDVGAIDADGFITITDRLKNLIKTAGGKYVAPEPLEARLQRDRYIAAALVVGDQRPYIAALILPDWEPLREDHHLDGSPAELVDDDRAQGVIQAAIDAVNRDLAGFETIKRFRLISGEFTEAGGEVTPKQSLRRKVIEQRYQELIDEMYGTPRSA